MGILRMNSIGMQSMRYSPPSPNTIPRGPSVECFTQLGMDRHSTKNESKHDEPCTNRQEWSFTGMNGKRSMRRRAWYRKYALIHTSMYWYVLYRNVASKTWGIYD